MPVQQIDNSVKPDQPTHLKSSSGLINPKYRPLVYTAAIAIILAVGAVFSRWETLRITGVTVLTGIGYGIINDMFACRDCIEYFTVGHIYDGQKLRKRPLLTLNPNLNAIAWGTIATWHVATIAGIVLAMLARAPLPRIPAKISAKQLAAPLAIGAALLFIVAHVLSRAAKKHVEDLYKKGDKFSYYKNVPDKFKPGWHACNVRNSTGYLGLAIGGALLAIAIIVTRIGFKVL